MANIFGGFDTSSLWMIAKIVIWLFLFLIFCLTTTGAILFLVVKTKQTKVFEIDSNKRIRTFNGRYKKHKATNLYEFWAGKIKRYLPRFQQRDIHTKGKQDALLLFKDNNGKYHTLRVPTWKQLRKWYEVVYNIDLVKGMTIPQKEGEKPKKVDEDELKKLRSVYFEPSPHEDLDWLANQVAEAHIEFKDLQWWQHPNVMILGAAAIAAFIFIINLMVIYMMNK